MLTDQEALAAIDPSLPDEERAELASRVKASSAALDAYYDSRPQLEQIIAEASGHKAVPTFASLNKPGVAAGSVDGTAVDEGAESPAIEKAEPVADAEVVESAEDKEIAELEARVAALRAKKGA
jgi:hypothetical protein